MQWKLIYEVSSIRICVVKFYQHCNSIFLLSLLSNRIYHELQPVIRDVQRNDIDKSLSNSSILHLLLKIAACNSSLSEGRSDERL